MACKRSAVRSRLAPPDFPLFLKISFGPVFGPGRREWTRRLRTALGAHGAQEAQRGIEWPARRHMGPEGIAQQGSSVPRRVGRGYVASGGLGPLGRLASAFSAAIAETRVSRACRSARWT
jgi:hypothetical protein